MIRFGIAGIPLTSKGRTFIESVEDVHNLGLNALEVQLLRVNIEERPALEYTGMKPKDVDGSIIVEVLRSDENGNYRPVGIESTIEEDDIVQEIFWNMAKNYDELREGGELAKELDVNLSMHAPYYMDLLDDGDIGEKSYDHLRWTLITGKAMQAKRVVTHTGFYKANKKESLKRAIEVYTRVAKACPPSENFPFVSVECSGKAEIFGATSDLTALAKKVPEIEPIINFPHIHSLTGGSLIEIKDFEDVLDEFSKFSKGDLYTEFSGVEYQDHNETKLTAIKHGDLKFETLAEAIANREEDITLISSSPLLEHDAQYMYLIYLRTFSKRLQKKSPIKKAIH